MQPFNPSNRSKTESPSPVNKSDCRWISVIIYFMLHFVSFVTCRLEDNPEKPPPGGQIWGSLHSSNQKNKSLHSTGFLTFDRLRGRNLDDRLKGYPPGRVFKNKEMRDAKMPLPWRIILVWQKTRNQTLIASAWKTPHTALCEDLDF